MENYRKSAHYTYDIKWRVKARVESGGYDVPEEKIITRYDRTLALVKDLIKVCDICHIYDNSAGKPFRIFKKRKELMHYDECDDWYFGDIWALTDVSEYAEEKSELSRIVNLEIAKEIFKYRTPVYNFWNFIKPNKM